MTKRSRVTLFGLLALIAAFGLILTGCPDPNTETKTEWKDKEVLSWVTLETGSWGEVGTDDAQSITLENGHYLVKNFQDGKWYTTVTTGTTLTLLGTDGVLSAANIAGVTAAGAIQGGGTAITELANGRYGVYKYFALADEAGAVIGAGSAFDNEGKNAVVNIAALSDGKTVVAGPGAGKALPGAPSTIVFLIDKAIEGGAIENGAVANLLHQSNIQGTLYYSFLSSTVRGAKVQAKAGEAFITLSGVRDLMKTTLRVDVGAITPPAMVSLGAGSAGEMGDQKITDLTSGKKYVVFDGDGWNVVKADGSLERIELTATAISAAWGSDFAGLTETAITGLTNGTTYTVYQYFDTVTDGQIIPTTPALNNSELNAIYNISDLAVGEKVRVATGAGSGDNSIIFLIKGAIPLGSGSGAINSATPLATQEGIKNTLGNPWFYGFSVTTSPGTTKVQAKAGDAFIALSTVDALAATTLSVSGVKVGAGAPDGAVGGDGKITGLTASTKYLVHDDDADVWYKVTAATGTTESITLTAAVTTEALGASAEITGLTNGTTYSVYLYKVLGNGETVGTTGDFENEGANAVINISALTAGQSVDVITGAGDGSTKLIFVLGGDITASPVATAVTLAAQDDIKTSAKSYEFSDTEDANTTQVQAEVGKAYITLSTVDAATETTLSVSLVRIGAGSPAGATRGNGKITGLAVSTKYLVHDDDADKWYKVGTDAGAIDSTPITLNATNAATTTELSSTAEEISGLTNGTKYSVYLYGGELATGSSVGASAQGDVNNAGVNVVVDISDLVVGNSVSVADAAGSDVNSVIFLIADTVATTVESVGLDDQEIKNTHANNPWFYGFSGTAAVEDTEVAAKADDAFITLSTVGSDTVTTLKVIGTKLAVGSQGTAGDGKITVAAGHYLVKNGSDGKWYTTNTATTGLVELSGSGVLSAANITATTNVGDITSTGTEITGLTNGVTYDVYAYKALATTDSIDDAAGEELTTGGKNAIANVASIAGSGDFDIKAGGLGINATLIILIDDASGRALAMRPEGSGVTLADEYVLGSTGAGGKSYALEGQTITVVPGTATALAVTAGDKYFTLTGGADGDFVAQIKVTTN